MSYIIAFVKFSASGDSYPVECFRTDVTVGDDVLVQLPQRRLTPARVVQISYLSWNCAGEIRGKASEAVLEEDGYWSLLNCPTVVGLATNEVFIAELKRQGWVPLKRGHVHMAAVRQAVALQRRNPRQSSCKAWRF